MVDLANGKKMHETYITPPAKRQCFLFYFLFLRELLWQIRILTISFNWRKLRITVSAHRVNLFALIFMPEENKPT